MDFTEAKNEKNDEFYTQLEDIEKELCHYKEHFRDKVIFCNCDDPYESNFFKYFAMNFNYLGLKKLIATCYVSSPVMYTQLSLFEDMEYSVSAPSNPKKKPYKVEITEVSDENEDGAFDLDDIKHLLKNKKNVCSVLKDDGDFRSPECVELLKEADIVVTNPPFSLFREYIALLMNYQKKFLIIGNINAITYKEFFPLIKENKVWVGYKFNGKPMEFVVPDSYPLKGTVNGYLPDGRKYIGVGGTCWYTNLDIDKRHEELILYKNYNPNDYPSYVNFDGIEVSKTNEIPSDYFGLMGVPISFLDKYNPNQFDIVGFSLDLALSMKDIAPKGTYMQGGKRFYTKRLTASDIQHGFLYHREYDRLVIRRKEQPT